jgi:O-methyltransferase involved in polyketide biosynthesis
MAKQTVGRTALGAAVCRLIEQYQPRETRLFTDLVVQGLVGAPIQLMLRLAGMRNFTIRQTDGIADGIFGLEPSRLPEFLEQFHLTLIEDVGNADYQEKYLKPIGRKLVVSEGERIVQAAVI